MGTPQWRTVIIFLENGFKLFVFGFLLQFWTNRAEFLIWCIECINEEPLTRIFWKFKKNFPEFSGFSKKFYGAHEKLKKKLFLDSSKSLLQHPLGRILRRAGPKNGQNGPSSFQIFLLCFFSPSVENIRYEQLTT